MRELEKEVKPRAEEERKEAADQEEEDVEVEYNEVGAWELQQGHEKMWKDLEVSEEVGNRCTGKWMCDLGITGGRSRPWKAVQAETEAVCGSCTCGRLGWTGWEPGRLWENWGDSDRFECPPSLELTEACLGEGVVMEKGKDGEMVIHSCIFLSTQAVTLALPVLGEGSQGQQVPLFREAHGMSAALLSQPTVHFAEDTLIRSEDEDEDEERPFPVEKQRLIRKDTPHYKKHFKITKLPKPEAVVALLQGLNSDGVPNEEEELGGCNNNTEPEDQEEAWDEDDRKSGALSAQPSVKVRSCGTGEGQRDADLPSAPVTEQPG